MYFTDFVSIFVFGKTWVCSWCQSSRLFVNEKDVMSKSNDAFRFVVSSFEYILFSILSNAQYTDLYRFYNL